MSEQQPFARYEADRLLVEACDLLSAGINKVGRQRRNQAREQIGAVPPVGTDRKTRTAASVNGNGDVRERSGNADGKAARSYIDLKWKTYPKDQANKIGHVDMSSRQHVVWLNEEHPFLTWCRDEKNVVAIATVAASLWAARNTFYTGDNQGCLQYGDDPPEPKWQRKLSGLLVNVGSKHKAVHGSQCD